METEVKGERKQVTRKQIKDGLAVAGLDVPFTSQLVSFGGFGYGDKRLVSLKDKKTVLTPEQYKAAREAMHNIGCIFEHSYLTTGIICG